MEFAEEKLGSSLKVPSVQELAKQNLPSVPARYIRTDQEDQLSSTPPTDCSSLEMPVVDMQRLLARGEDAELQKLHLACKDWGFFQLINHGVSSSLLDKVKLESEAFFNLPIEEKKKFEQKAEDVEGLGQVFVVSEEQNLDWGDMFYLVTQPTALRKPHLFPKLPTPFREALEEYSRKLKDLEMKILNQMAKALGMKIEDMSVLFEEGMQSMRMNYYPPCPQPELVTGLYPHSDSVGLTILLQVSEVEGLQIRKNGAWFPVVPLPNAFIVNIGDILEIVTNGIYPSIEHRAVVNGDKERISIATFLIPKLDGDMGPAPSLITTENPSKFKRISIADYLRGLFSRQLSGKSYVEAMRI